WARRQLRCGETSYAIGRRIPDCAEGLASSVSASVNSEKGQCGVASRRWLISSRTDFWFVSAAASGALLAAIAFIFIHGDRELDWADLVFSELHIGATYGVIVRRRLWQRLPGDVVLTPLLILAATYMLARSDHWLLITTITMYAAIWHRGRQNL